MRTLIKVDTFSFVLLHTPREGHKRAGVGAAKEGRGASFTERGRCEGRAVGFLQRAWALRRKGGGLPSPGVSAAKEGRAASFAKRGR